MTIKRFYTNHLPLLKQKRQDGAGAGLASSYNAVPTPASWTDPTVNDYTSAPNDSDPTTCPQVMACLLQPAAHSSTMFVADELHAPEDGT